MLYFSVFSRLFFQIHIKNQPQKMFKIRVEENIQKKKHSEIEGVKVVYRIFVFQLKKDFAQKIKKRFLL